MISLRLWLDDRHVFSARRRDILAIEDVVRLIGEGQGPSTTGDFLVTIVERLFARMEPVLEDLEDTLSNAEERLVLGNAEEIATTVAVIRRKTTIFTRYVCIGSSRGRCCIIQKGSRFCRLLRRLNTFSLTPACLSSPFGSEPCT